MFKKYGKYFVLGFLVVAVAVSGISAYFTATDDATNNFNVHEVDVELHEPEWDPDVDTDDEDTLPDAVSDVTPNETIAKDPQVENTGNTDQFVFLKVAVPYKSIITAGLDGKRTSVDPVETELFTWNSEDANRVINAAPEAKTGAVNGEWTLVSTYKDTTNKVVEYTYAYGSATAMTVLEPDAFTTPLFNSITMCNAIEGQGLENTTLAVDIDVYAIQTSDLGASGENATVVPSAVLEIYLNQNN